MTAPDFDTAEIEPTRLRPGGTRRVGLMLGLAAVALTVAITKPWPASPPPAQTSRLADATLRSAGLQSLTAPSISPTYRSLVVTATCADGSRPWAKTSADAMVTGGQIGGFGSDLRCADGTIARGLTWTIAHDAVPH
jgi:hypothetical protein